CTTAVPCTARGLGRNRQIARVSGRYIPEPAPRVYQHLGLVVFMQHTSWSRQKESFRGGGSRWRLHPPPRRHILLPRDRRSRLRSESSQGAGSRFSKIPRPVFFG